MRKKLVSLLLILSVILSLQAVACAGGATLTISPPETMPKAGESFTVSVGVSDNPGLRAVELLLAYDEDAMTCVGVRRGEVLTSDVLVAVNENANGGAKLAAASMNTTTDDGEVALFDFTAEKDVTEWELSIPELDLRDADSKKLYTKVALLDVTPETETAAEKKTEELPIDGIDEIKDEPEDENVEKPTDEGGSESESTPTISIPVISESAKTEPTYVPVEFTDMDGHWSEEYVDRAVEMGIFSGYPDGSFRPENVISRAEFVTVLWRSAGSPEPKEASGFTDVPESEYYAKAVAWARENGYVDGISESEFDPTGTMQRQAAMKVLYYYNGGVSGIELLLASQYDAAFTDSISLASWARMPVYWAYAKGIISGTSENTLSPTSAVTRAQVAKILVNYLDIG